MSIVSPGEGRLRGFIRALTALKDSIKSALEQDSHLSLYDAMQHTKCVEPDLYDQLENLPSDLRDSLNNAMAKVVGRKNVKMEDFNSVLDDCYESVNRSLDVMNGRAPVLIPDVPPVKRLKLGPFEGPNILMPVDRAIFVRKVHPYESVINSLTFSDPWMINAWGAKDVDPESVEATPCVYVDTVGALREMVAGLQMESVICVDLENHNYYSYNGFTCLLQFSSWSVDYLVDAIKLKTELKEELPKILSDPKILKLLHGAEHDSNWLQRDFDCHLVSVFDTFIAAKRLDLVKKSLNGLLQHYFDISLDKQYQLADWRVRPLPEEMLKYARLDTHYLIPLWERMKSALIEMVGVEGLLKVYQQSSVQCLKLYRPENEDLGKWKNIVTKSSVLLDDSQQAIVKRVFEWRDEIAREHDVCHHAILANHWIVRLAMSKPVSANEVKRCLRDGYTRFVDNHADQLVRIIKDENLKSVQECVSAVESAPMDSQVGANAEVKEQAAPKLLKRQISVSAMYSNQSKSSFVGIMNTCEKVIESSVVVVPHLPSVPAIVQEVKPIEELVETESKVMSDKMEKEQELNSKVESIINHGPLTIPQKPAKKRTLMQVEDVDLDQMTSSIGSAAKDDLPERKHKSRHPREKDSVEDKKEKFKKKRAGRGRFLTFSK